MKKTKNTTITTAEQKHPISAFLQNGKHTPSRIRNDQRVIY